MREGSAGSLFDQGLLVMSGQHKDEGLHNDARRNVVIPNTLQNAGRFWRNIYSGKQTLSLARWIGVLVLFLFLGGSGTFYLVMLWPGSTEPWWQQVIKGYGVYVVVIGALILFAVRGSRSARHKPSATLSD